MATAAKLVGSRRPSAGDTGVVWCAMPFRDSDRPPVLAHRRFLADKKSFADLNLAQRFRRIHDTNMWGAAASTSGLGSELDATAVLRAELPRLFKKLGVTFVARCALRRCGLDQQRRSQRAHR